MGGTEEEPPGGGGGLPLRPGVEIAVIVGEFSRFRETVFFNQNCTIDDNTLEKKHFAISYTISFP